MILENGGIFLLMLLPHAQGGKNIFSNYKEIEPLPLNSPLFTTRCLNVVNPHDL